MTAVNAAATPGSHFERILPKSEASFKGYGAHESHLDPNREKGPAPHVSGEFDLHLRNFIDAVRARDETILNGAVHVGLRSGPAPATLGAVIGSLALFLAGLLLLYLGAEGLVRGASALSLRIGLHPLVTGLVIVAYGTSMPELVVSVEAAWLGEGPLALANVVGSNICTIGVVLGVAVLIIPLTAHRMMVRFHVPLMIVAVALLFVFLRDGRLDRLEGGLLLCGGVAYTVSNIVLARRQSDPRLVEEYKQAVGGRRRPMALDLGLLGAGLAGLFLGADLLIDGTTGLATGLGVDSALVGLTVVALGTSAPDLMATIVAAIKREPDIALGNVVGSVLFNVFSAAGVAALVRPMDATGIDRYDLYVMLGMALLLLPLMRTGFVLKRWEGGVFCGLYLVYLAMRYTS